MIDIETFLNTAKGIFMSTIQSVFTNFIINKFFKKDTSYRDGLFVDFGEYLIGFHNYLCLAREGITYSHPDLDKLIELKIKLRGHLKIKTLLKTNEIIAELKLYQTQDRFELVRLHLDDIDITIDKIEEVYNNIKLNDMPAIENSHIKAIEKIIEYR